MWSHLHSHLPNIMNKLLTVSLLAASMAALGFQALITIDPMNDSQFYAKNPPCSPQYAECQY